MVPAKKCALANSITNIVLSLILVSNQTMGMDTPPSGVTVNDGAPKRRRIDYNGAVPVNDTVSVIPATPPFLAPHLVLLPPNFGPHIFYDEDIRLSNGLDGVPRPEARRAGEMNNNIPLSAVSSCNQRVPKVSEEPPSDSKNDGSSSSSKSF